MFNYNFMSEFQVCIYNFLLTIITGMFCRHHKIITISPNFLLLMQVFSSTALHLKTSQLPFFKVLWYFLSWIEGFPDSSVGKVSTCNVGDLDSIPGLGRSPGEGKGYPLPYSGLENSMDCIVHGVAKSWTRMMGFV